MTTTIVESVESRPSKEVVQQFAQTLEAHRGERHVVVLQDYPDPDAISSAFAHRYAASRYDIEVDIVHAGCVSHQQNIALVKLIGIDLHLFDSTFNPEQYTGAVFLDNQGTSASTVTQALSDAKTPAVMVIDHHEGQNAIEAEFSDIRKSAGATATIYADYLRHGLIELDTADTDHVKIATALMHGIITDTHQFVRAGANDFTSASYLSRYTDADLLANIMMQARSKQTMNITQEAIRNRQVVENFSISGIGYLRSQDRDAIPQAADFLMTEENVHTAIVYGIVTGEDVDETLVGSMRTSKITLNPDGFIKEVFGKDAGGNYFGGGKLSAGGFRIPIGFLSGGPGEGFKEKKWELYDTQIHQMIFAKLGITMDDKD